MKYVAIVGNTSCTPKGSKTQVRFRIFEAKDGEASSTYYRLDPSSIVYLIVLFDHWAGEWKND